MNVIPTEKYTKNVILRFCDIVTSGRSAALDKNQHNTIILRVSVSPTGEEGLKNPPKPFSDNWTRMIEIRNGKIYK